MSITPSAVIQTTDYYPYGLAYNEQQRESSIHNRYLFNKGSERQEDLGLNVYQTHYRMYDPAIGRWWQEDPRADIPSQIELTPYNFGDNDPVAKNDPNGDCPWCVGALIGAATDYAAQVAVNLAEGKDLSSSLTDVDLGSIATSAVLGAVTSGVSAVTRTIGATTVKQVAKTTTQKVIQQTTKAVTATAVKVSKTLNEKGVNTSRPTTFRKQTTKNNWNEAKDGKQPNTKECPTCGKDVKGNPNQGEKRNGDDGWDNSHKEAWSNRDHSQTETRKEVLDDYNKGTTLECQTCNRGSGNQNDSRFNK